jgi:hypothetical protein
MVSFYIGGRNRIYVGLGSRPYYNVPYKYNTMVACRNRFGWIKYLSYKAAKKKRIEVHIYHAIYGIYFQRL